jgi:hypothetical protein
MFAGSGRQLLRIRGGALVDSFAGPTTSPRVFALRLTRIWAPARATLGARYSAANAAIEFALVMMYITDLRHFLDDSLLAPSCFKCKKSSIQAAIAPDDAIDWACSRCKVGGRISNWQSTLWDLSDRPG